MILLDTDHLSLLKYPESPKYSRLIERMQSSGESVFATTIVNAEEQMRGWLALIHKVLDVHKQVEHYVKLGLLFDLFRRWEIVPFDSLAADEFKRLRKQGVRIGSQDLKIAAIALTHAAPLLSANLRDFRRVPGLLVESWLD